MADSPWPVQLLNPAVEAGRKALADLESDQVPDRVRRVSASSDRKLTPPLARALLDELDGNDDLRQQALEQLLDSRRADDGPSLLFLERPEGWRRQIAELGGEATSRALEQENASLRRQLQGKDRQLRQAKQKARDATQAAAQATAAAKAAHPSSAAKSPSDSGTAELLKRIGELEAEQEEMGARLADTEERLVRARAEVLRSRRANLADARASAGLPLADPLELAKHLDTVAGALSAVSVEAQPSGAAATGLAIPSGVRPDRRESIDWLLEQTGAVSVVVDGYNVTFKIDRRRFHEGVARDRLDHQLGELRRLARGRLRVIVVYDSGFGGEADEARGPGGIERMFAAEGRTADEEIVQLVPSLPTAVVVVSSDRAVREQSERLGSLGLWSEALAEWIAAR